MPYRISDLPGVGDHTAAQLHEAGFETLQEVRDASAVDLLAVDSVGPATVRQLMDAEPAEPDLKEGMITYQFTISADDWQAWKDTLGEDSILKHELRSLIRRASMRETDNDDDAKVAALQARRHGMRALQSVDKSNQKAKDEINQIMRLMDRIV